jgi:O-antigen ligase
MMDKEFYSNDQFSIYVLTIILFSFLLLRPLSDFLETFRIFSLKGVTFLPLILIFLLIVYLLLRYKGKELFLDKKISISTLLLFLLFTWIFLIQVFSFPWTATVYGINNYIFVFYGTIVFSFIMIIIGMNIRKIFYAFNIKFIKILYWFVYCIFISMIFYSLVNNPFFDKSEFITFQIYTANYLNIVLSDPFLILSLIIINNLKKEWVKLLFWILTIILLYITASRTTFYFSIITFILLYIYKFIKAKKLLKLSLIILLVIFLLTLINIPSLNNFVENRMLILSYQSLIEDRSFQERFQQFEYGLNDLKENWFLGEHMSYYRYGGQGAYMHNWLSFWLAYGIFPFILFIFLVLSLLIKILTFNYKKSTEKGLAEFIISLFIFTLLSIIFSRSYTYIYIWLSLASSVTFFNSFCKNNVSSPNSVVFTQFQK